MEKLKDLIFRQQMMYRMKLQPLYRLIMMDEYSVRGYKRHE